MAAISWREWARGLAIAAAAGLFLALSGAFTSGAVPLTARLAYWIPVMMAGSVFGRLMSMLVVRIPRATANEFVFSALLAVAIAAPVTVAIWAYSNFFFGQPFRLVTLPYYAPAVLIISMAMVAIMMLARPGRMTHAAASSAPPTAPRFLERLPPKLRGAALYAIQAEDHYLRLHTSKGSDLILMRLADAIVELDGVEGAQTHRSWWVAKDAVESATRARDRIVLKLKGGAEAPVSRANIRALRDAGWF